MFFCAQQSKADLFKQKMTQAYFESLWNWLRAEGFAYISNYLWRYPIPDHMNPIVGSMTAPETSMHKVAIEASRGAEASLVAEAIDADTPGFKGGWVSTTKAKNLLLENRYSGSPRKISAILEREGFVKHPGLPNEGRATRDVVAEGMRPRLWVRDGHPSMALMGNDVVDEYEIAQGYKDGKPLAPVIPIRR